MDVSGWKGPQPKPGHTTSREIDHGSHEMTLHYGHMRFDYLISCCLPLHILQFVQWDLFYHDQLLLLDSPTTKVHLTTVGERMDILIRTHQNKSYQRGTDDDTTSSQAPTHPKAPCPITLIFSYCSICPQWTWLTGRL